MRVCKAVTGLILVNMEIYREEEGKKSLFVSFKKLLANVATKLARLKESCLCREEPKSGY